jgi:hypothetical protein
MFGYLVSLVLIFVQQPCSNPSKYPDTLRKALTQEYIYFQVFCKLQKTPAIYRAAFTRQRSLVRSQHRPLPKVLQMAGKHKLSVLTSSALCSNHAATHQSSSLNLLLVMESEPESTLSESG